MEDIARHFSGMGLGWLNPLNEKVAPNKVKPMLHCELNNDVVCRLSSKSVVISLFSPRTAGTNLIYYIFMRHMGSTKHRSFNH